jgi:hypothetical protein
MNPALMARTTNPMRRPTELHSDWSEIPWPAYDTYIENVCLYNERDLTFSQDVLIAFTGVLNRLNFPGGFVSGVPQAFLDEALLWQPRSKTTRRISLPNCSIAPQRLIPSWSWCGWRCLVEPQSLATGLDYLSDTSARERQRTWRTVHLVDWRAVSETNEEVPLDAGLLSRSRDHAISKGTFGAYYSQWRFEKLQSGDEDLADGEKIARLQYPLLCRPELPRLKDPASFPYLAGTVQHA